ncbi:MAG TPA: tetratricopeptide repeat protein [Pyrinomonadaceae bacterium]|nr:tetratricopeptide repeat protein [Pyrinomonadaceae bacterium]
MKNLIARPLAILLCALFAASPTLATCGGGGGGGVGGMSGGGGGIGSTPPQVYYVPWKVPAPDDPRPLGLVLYWFPRTNDELKRSSLRESRTLSLYSAQCVAMELADYREPDAKKLVGDSAPPVAVLAGPDGSVIGKAENKDGILKVEQVEKLVSGEMTKREGALDASLKDGREKAKAGDKDGAVKSFRAVLDQKCLFPKKAKDAEKELKKLGVGEVAEADDSTDTPSPVFDPRASARITRTMRAGLVAEMAARYPEAERLYGLAHRLDPADPTPLRYLGELYRHHTGEWDKARVTFEAILNMQADPLSRAVAQHGLGKMTIHDGEFRKGLSLIEESVRTYPTPLAYRNLAVFWNSEGDAAKTERYIKKALALDPEDPYNLVFAAAFMAGTGHADEALKIAREHESLLPASYNLAAVYAQAGQRDKALALLRRHFFEYERYRSVRAKEMMEARVDAVFGSLREDPAFVALTNGADGRLPIPGKGMGAGTNR